MHWLTDLAGAVPTPLEGSEKFVLQFPRPVLGSFIKSFGGRLEQNLVVFEVHNRIDHDCLVSPVAVLNELAVKTETQERRAF